MKSILSALLLIALILSCVSCNKNDNVESDTQCNHDTAKITDALTEKPTEASTEKYTEQSNNNSNEENSPKHYEFELTLSNFDKYISYKTESGETKDGITIPNSVHILTGVLPYAYYEDVVVVFVGGCTKCSERKAISVSLNAGGCGEFVDFEQKRSCKQVQHRQSDIVFTIASISGKVIFSM